MKWHLHPVAVVIAVMPALANADAVAVANAALEELRAAEVALTEAKRASDRVAALTQTVKAYESGLAALRDGLRQVALREAVIAQSFAAESEKVSRLLGALEALQTAPETLLLLHPVGPVASVRSGMILAEVTPSLQAEVEHLKQRLDEVRLIRLLQESALDSLGAGLAGVQEARTELSKAISDRTDLPQRFANDTEALALLTQNSDTLASFAAGLGEIETLVGAPDFDETAVGPRALPVNGQIVRRFNEPDAAGITRPGVLIATAALAMVQTPVPSTIRYLGPLLDYGNVIILEPDEDTLLVLAGLDQVYGAVGDVIPAGTPVGLMGGEAPKSQEFLAKATEGGGAELAETLYLEVRQDAQPIDPMGWFAETKDESR